MQCYFSLLRTVFRNLNLLRVTCFIFTGQIIFATAMAALQMNLYSHIISLILIFVITIIRLQVTQTNTTKACHIKKRPNEAPLQPLLPVCCHSHAVAYKSAASLSKVSLAIIAYYQARQQPPSFK